MTSFDFEDLSALIVGKDLEVEGSIAKGSSSSSSSSTLKVSTLAAFVIRSGTGDGSLKKNRQNSGLVRRLNFHAYVLASGVGEGRRVSESKNTQR